MICLFSGFVRPWTIGCVLAAACIWDARPMSAQSKQNPDEIRFGQWLENTHRQTVRLSGLVGFPQDNESIEFGTARAIFRSQEVLSFLGFFQGQFELFRRGQAISERLAKDHPREPEYQLLLARYWFVFGNRLNWREASFEQKKQIAGIFERCAMTARGLVAESPNEPRYSEFLARCESTLATLTLNILPEKSTEFSHNAIEQWEKLVKNHGPTARYLVHLSYDYTGVCSASMMLGKKDEFKLYSRKALDLRENLLQRYPQQAARYIDVGGSQCNLGSYEFDANHKSDEAFRWFEKSIRTLEKGLRLDPAAINGTDYLRNARWGQMIVFIDQKKLLEADSAWDEVKKLANPANLPQLRLNRAFELARVDRGQEALQEADELAKTADKFRVDALKFARIYIRICQSKQQNQKTVERCEEQAVLWLTAEIFKTGVSYKGWLKFLEDQNEFDRLRRRKDFQQMIKRIEKAIENEEKK